MLHDRGDQLIRVAFVAPYYYPATVYGGPATSMYGMGRALARAGCDVRVLTTNANGLGRVLAEPSGERTLEPGLRVRYVARGFRHATSPALLAALPAYVGWCDVVHIGSAYNFPTIPTLIAARAYGKPAVLSPQGALQRWERSTKAAAKAAYERVCRAAAPGRFALHVTSRSEEEQSRERIPEAQCAYIPHSVTVPEMLPDRTTDDGVLRLAALGRLHPIKGLENLIDACARLELPGGKSWTLTLAGTGDPGYVEALRARVASLGLGGQVRFAGHVDGEAKAALLATMDLLVAPSFTENFGLAIAEALAHGVPVIASTGTPWRDLDVRGAGLWVDNDASSLAAAITKAATLPLSKMGESGRRWMLDEFTTERQGRAFVALYESLLAR